MKQKPLFHKRVIALQKKLFYKRQNSDIKHFDSGKQQYKQME